MNSFANSPAASRRLGWVSLLLCLAVALPASAQTNDSGTVSLTARVSGYVDIASGGPALLTGHLNGLITGNTAKGDRLNGTTINLGDISPANANSFVRVTVPLRLRSNIAYTLSIQTSGFANSDPLAIQSADVGFGIANIRRTDAGVNTAGTDTITTGVSGDPSLDPDYDTATPRWDFSPAKSLATYTSTQAVLSGSRIMNVVPASSVGGMLVDSFFVVKPQFFTPGTFTTTVTYTISTP